MKTKFFLTALCLCLACSAMAQRHGNRNNRNANDPQSTPHRIDMVVDTAIINSMNLEPEMVTAVLELQAQKSNELRAKLIEMATSRQQAQNQMPTPEEIAAMQTQIEEFKFEYRMKLRKILGVENYINYLEKQIDKRPQQPMGMNTPRRNGNNMNASSRNLGNGQDNNWGNGAPNGFGGGFDSNDNFGGGFGE